MTLAGFAFCRIAPPCPKPGSPGEPRIA